MKLSGYLRIAVSSNELNCFRELVGEDCNRGESRGEGFLEDRSLGDEEGDVSIDIPNGSLPCSTLLRTSLSPLAMERTGVCCKDCRSFNKV